MGKKALAVISHGTVADARGYTFVRNRLIHAFPEYDLFEAYTSPRVIARLNRERGIEMPSCAQQLERLCELGYREVACQSLHIIPGDEYEKILTQMKFYAYRFDRLTTGVPLLWDRRDLQVCADMLSYHVPPDGQHAIIWIGHGSQNAADIRYETLGRLLNQEKNQFVSTLERGWKSVLPMLQEKNINTVRLMPLMLTAARHVERDIAGTEDNSWRAGLTAAGYEVEVCFTGLGEYEKIADLFCRHFQESL